VTVARVLVVDDSVVIRRLITQALDAAPDIEVVGTASNGRLALAKLDQLRPDVVTLDIEMPEMDGLQTLAAIRARQPRLPVIMFSTLTERGGRATLEALALGATDYVTKPSNSGSLDVGLARIQEELIPRIRALTPRLAPARTAPAPVAAAARPTGPTPRVQALAIGVSTGGPSALAELIPALPANLGVPVLVCQHMPPVFTRLLAERLDAKSELHVQEAADGQQVAAGGVWIAPGGFHMVVHRPMGGGPVIRTTTDEPENSCRPAVDPMLRSAVATWGSGVLAVVLTGMGQDGLRGCQDVTAAGGRVLVQDEASSVVWGMPGYVARAGLADAALPLDELAVEITRRVAGVPAASARSER
jgi:two-component system, chemotaxis family, protein-glutamate methylesterase/glutaminase